MTIKDFREAIEKNNIPENAKLYGNSGWECGASEVGGMYYSPSKNELHLVQSEQDRDCEYDEDNLKSGSQKAHDWVFIK